MTECHHAYYTSSCLLHGIFVGQNYKAVSIQHQDNMTEWDITSSCLLHDKTAGQHYKAASVQYQDNMTECDIVIMIITGYTRGAALSVYHAWCFVVAANQYLLAYVSRCF